MNEHQREKQRLYQKEYRKRLDVKVRDREYQRRPEVKARRKARCTAKQLLWDSLTPKQQQDNLFRYAKSELKHEVI